MSEQKEDEADFEAKYDHENSSDEYGGNPMDESAQQSPKIHGTSLPTDLDDDATHYPSSKHFRLDEGDEDEGKENDDTVEGEGGEGYDRGDGGAEEKQNEEKDEDEESPPRKLAPPSDSRGKRRKSKRPTLPPPSGPPPKNLPPPSEPPPNKARRRSQYSGEDDEDEAEFGGQRHGSGSSGSGRKKSAYSGEEGYGDGDDEEKAADEEATIKRRRRRELFQQRPLLVSPFSGLTTNLVQCVIIREKAGGGMFLPRYTLFFQGQDTPAMVAVLQGANRTTNYHLFDMTRGVLTNKLSKKSGNYMGKLRSNMKKTESCLYTNNASKEEVASISFERPNIMAQLKEGSQPRKLHILLPELDEEGCPIPVSSEATEIRSEILQLAATTDTPFYQIETKEPVFENGNYRLNFHGRVTIPSVKNYQLTTADDIHNVICQFGKVGENKFHLDYKFPLNAYQAFAIALTQFSL